METKGKRPPRVSRSGVEAATAAAAALAANSSPPPAPAVLEPDSPPAPTVLPASDGIDRVGHETLAAFVESQAAAARGWEAINEELAALARAGIDIAAHAATQMLEVETMCDAYRVTEGFARKSCDSLLDGSAKLSRLTLEVAAEASRPILTQFGEGWIKTVCCGF